MISVGLVIFGVGNSAISHFDGDPNLWVQRERIVSGILGVVILCSSKFRRESEIIE